MRHHGTAHRVAFPTSVPFGAFVESTDLLLGHLRKPEFSVAFPVMTQESSHDNGRRDINKYYIMSTIV